MAKATNGASVAHTKMAAAIAAVTPANDSTVLFHFGPIGYGSQKVEFFVYSDYSSLVLIYGLPGTIGPFPIGFAPGTTQEFVWETVESVLPPQ